MNSTTQLALMVKAKRVFETDGTFLSFPVLSPFAYPPEKLQFVGPAADLPTLGEFSRLVNQVPRGTLFQPIEDVYLWDVYANLFRIATVEVGTATREQTAAYERAAAILHMASPDGLRQDTPVYRTFKQYRDAWIAATEEYKAGQVTADASTELTVKTRWQSVDEPALRGRIAQIEAGWATDGFRAMVEEAERAVRTYTERPTSGLLWDEWRDAFNPDIDTLTDPLTNQPFAPTAFSPSDPFDDEWPPFSLSAEEVAALRAQAPPELKEVLDLTETGPTVAGVSFQFRSVGLTRPWLRSEVFRSRFWRLPASEPPLSDGGSPPQGSCPAYVTGVVFARAIVEVTRQPGGTTNSTPIKTMPALKVRPQLVQPVPIPPARLTVRPTPGVRPPAASPHLTTSPARHQIIVDQPRAVARPGRDVRSVSQQLQRLNMNAFTIRPAQLHPVAPRPPAPPPAGSPAPSAPPTRDISILAFICKRLPKCPDPDPSLPWTG
jgi:hypothetical protein